MKFTREKITVAMVTYENRAFREMIQYFIAVDIINRILHGRLEIRNFSSRVEKNFARSLRSLVKYFSALEEKFRISKRPCNILYISQLFSFPVQITSASFANETADNSDSSLSSFRSLRTLRALRPLRAISRWEGMKVKQPFPPPILLVA